MFTKILGQNSAFSEGLCVQGKTAQGQFRRPEEASFSSPEEKGEIFTSLTGLYHFSLTGSTAVFPNAPC